MAAAGAAAALAGRLADPRIPRPRAHGQLQRRLETVGETRADVRAHDDAVDDDVDVVLQLLVERRRVGDLVIGAVDLEALEAAPREFGDLFSVFALAAAHDRREQIEPRPCGSASTRSTICETVWLSIGRPVAGE